MADELKTVPGLECVLIEGSRGIFDVKVDGVLVFSKYQTNRFPNDGEVLAKVRG